MLKWEDDKNRIKPILDWTNGELENGALEQAANLARLPFVHQHIALMPDAHRGYGMPIGGVAGFINAISPYCVGNDIGCGMRVVRTNIKASSLDQRGLIELRNHIKGIIPVGGGKVNPVPQKWEGFATWELDQLDLEYSNNYEPWCDEAGLRWFKRSMATLGGGNHFIEFQKDNDDNLYVMIHSGSRNIGAKICTFYHNLALELCNKWHIKLPDNNLAYFPSDTIEAKMYLRDMGFALAFAKENRKRMMAKTLDVLNEKVNGDVVQIVEQHDVHHNYVALENHLGKNVWVHRKGATSAREGEICIIPGSQGTYSYIGRGKGNPLSFKTCSHGSGRVLGRKAAQRELILAKEQEKLDKKGIIHTLFNEKDLDEADGAYKDVRDVMFKQDNLVGIVTELSPIMSIKG